MWEKQGAVTVTELKPLGDERNALFSVGVTDNN